LIFAAEDFFKANDEILKQADQAQIEQFISTDNLTLVHNTDELTLSALLYTPAGTEDVQQFYDTVVSNLKQYAPKLRILHLFGGHTWYPKESTATAIQEEVVYSKNHLDALLKSLNKHNIIVSSNLLTIMLVADEKAQNQSNFEETVENQFGKDSVVDDSNVDGLELLFKIDDVDIHLYLVFINNLESVNKTTLPFGRCAYAISIEKHLDSIYEELEEQAKKRIKTDDSKLFVSGPRRLNKAGELHLEEFYGEQFVNSKIKDTTPQDTLEQLVLSIGVPPELNNITAFEFYTQAVKNLKKYAPNLKAVRLDGGYAFNPTEQAIDNDTIKHEIIWFHDNLAAVLKSFGDAQIIVHSLKLKVYWLSSKQNAKDSGYPALIKTSFNYEPTEADIDSGKVLMIFKLHDIQSSVDLHFFNQSPTHLPHGRTNYYSASKLYEEATGKEEKKSKSSESNSKSSGDKH
jgi:hypothetical protein